MNILNLNLSEQQAKELLEYYQNEYRKIESRRTEILELIEQLGGQPKKTKGSFTPVLFPDPEFHADWSLSEQARFILKRYNKCFPVREIAQQLTTYRDDVTNEEEFQNLYTSLSGTISTKIKNKQIFNSYKPEGSSASKVGLLEWFDANG